jgi:hypothetical protein
VDRTNRQTEGTIPLLDAERSLAVRQLEIVRQQDLFRVLCVAGVYRPFLPARWALVVADVEVGAVRAVNDLVTTRTVGDFQVVDSPIGEYRWLTC